MDDHLILKENILKKVKTCFDFIPAPTVVSHEWTVMNIDSVSANRQIKSPVLKIEDSSIEFYLAVFRYVDGSGRASLYRNKTKRVDQRDLNRQFSYWFEFLDSTGMVIADFIPMKISRVSEFVGDGIDLSAEQISRLHPEASVVCRIGMFDTDEVMPHCANTDGSKLSEEVINFITESPEDITIIGNDTGTNEGDNFHFPAHRLVLQARSQVFRAMLEHDTIEKSSGKIKMQDVPKQVLRAFLDFLYTDKVKNIEDMAVPLLILADKYQVTPLSGLCERHLLSNTNSSDVCTVLAAADMINHEKLKNHCIDIIHEYSSIHECPSEWKEFFKRSPHLYEDFFQRSFKCTSPV